MCSSHFGSRLIRVSALCIRVASLSMGKHQSSGNTLKSEYWSERTTAAPQMQVCSLSQPKSDISDLGHLKVPNSGRPEFGWERGGVRGFGLVNTSRFVTPSPRPSPQAGRGSTTEPVAPLGIDLSKWHRSCTVNSRLAACVDRNGSTDHESIFRRKFVTSG